MKSEEIFFQNLNNIDYFIQIVKSSKEILNDTATLIKHKFVIERYIITKYLDRKQAIDIYKKFNMDNIDYLLEMNFYLLFNPNNCVNLELSSNEVIIENLSLQLLYFCFKKTITYLNK